MKCQGFRRQVHPLLDGELPPQRFRLVQGHLGSCPGCRKHYRELARIREGLRPRRLSPGRQDWLWERIQGRLQPARPVAGRTLRARMGGAVRDLEPRAVGARLAAVPITLVLFLSVFVQFEPTLFREWTPPSLIIALSSSPSPRVQQMPVRFPRAEIHELMSAVRRIPFEDSLSLVAEITPEGNAQIDDVLEYPRSRELLEAVDLTLRGSSFERAGTDTRGQPFLIYSLQKVDVFGEYGGL